MIYMKAEITIHPGHVPAMLDLLTKRIFPVFEELGGWKMCGCFVQRTGRLNTIVDVWELEDYAHFERAYAVFRGHPEFPEFRKLLDTYVETETLVFMERQYGTIITGVQ